MTFMSAHVGPLRPPRWWYAVAAVTPLLALLAGAALVLVPPLLGGSPGQPVQAGQSVPLRFEAGEGADKMVWVTSAGPTAPAVTCKPAETGPGLEEWSSTSMASENIVRTADGRRWLGVLVIRAEPPGRHAVRCDVASAEPGVEVSIGEPPRFYGAKSQALALFGATSLGLVGVTAGAVIAIVVAIRRSAHRRRLSSLP